MTILLMLLSNISAEHKVSYSTIFKLAFTHILLQYGHSNQIHRILYIYIYI